MRFQAKTTENAEFIFMTYIARLICCNPSNKAFLLLSSSSKCCEKLFYSVLEQRTMAMGVVIIVHDRSRLIEMFNQMT